MPWPRNTKGPFSHKFLQRRFLYSEVRKGAPGLPEITTVTAGNNTTSGQCQRLPQDERSFLLSHLVGDYITDEPGSQVKFN